MGLGLNETQSILWPEVAWYRNFATAKKVQRSVFDYLKVCRRTTGYKCQLYPDHKIQPFLYYLGASHFLLDKVSDGSCGWNSHHQL